MASRDRRELAEVLLRKARGDETTVQVLAEQDVPDEVVGFHAQQAVEKALKAVLAFREIDYAFSHDLAYLSDLLEAKGVDVPSEVRAAEELRPWAAQFRYEDPGPDSSQLDRERARDLASTAVDWAARMLAADD